MPFAIVREAFQITPRIIPIARMNNITATMRWMPRTVNLPRKRFPSAAPANAASTAAASSA